jgi:3-isopropylmalate/(R)-2-methylmalate dehydratase large subunit
MKSLSMDGRFTMANMAVEAGAKNGIFEPDDVTRSYVEQHGAEPGTYLSSDPNAGYGKVLEIPVDDIDLQLAMPHSPDNVRSVVDVDPIPLDQVFIGSCTNGRMGDLQTAAQVLRGKSVARGTRLIVIPGSPVIYRQAIQDGTIESLLEAGAVIGPPCCGPCLGGHLGILAEGERAISTTNRNFVGRMGHPKSEVYLSGPSVAAASAVLGRIGSPEEL